MDRQKRILLIEDDKFLYDLYLNVLQKGGFYVEVADNGEDGLFKALNDNFDLILLDIMLPKKNGVDVLKELKEKGKNTPVLVLSNLGQEEIVQQCLTLGAVGYLIKVQNLPQDVVIRVNEVLESISGKQ